VALVDATPSLDVRSLLLFFTCLESNCWLSDGKDLLVLHLIVAFVVEELGLDIVLDLSFGLMSVLLVGEVERRGNLVWEEELEADFINTWLKNAIWDLHDLLLVLKELFLGLNLLMPLDSAGIIAFTLGLMPETDMGCLLTSLDLNLEVVGGAGLHNFEVDLTVDGVSWLIEGKLGLNLDLALGEVGSLV
jgi:hypothetical protein